MKLNKKEFLTRVKNSSDKHDKIKTSYSFDKRLFEEFKSICEKENVSQVKMLELFFKDIVGTK